MANETTTTTPTRIIPAFGRIYDPLMPYVYPLVRVVTGGMLIPHGWAKLVSGSPAGLAQSLTKMGIEPAYILATYIGALELVGGTMLVLGLFTRFVAGQVIGFMLVAAFKVHWAAGFFWSKGGYEYPLFWGMMALAILIQGGGRLSLDARIGKEL